MSSFAVKIEKIEEIVPHPNPEVERLELARLEGIGYWFVIPKNTYQIGENVIYFPIDSVLPQSLISVLFPSGSMLAGKDKNRVKTIKLKGAISQGLVSKLDILDGYENFGIVRDYKSNNEHLKWHHNSFLEFGNDCLVSNRYKLELGFDLTELLGIFKYEQSPETNQGNKGNLPPSLSHYDIENAERFEHFLSALMDEPVWVSEKLEGQQCNLIIYKDGSIKIASRNFERELSLENNWGAGWINSGILEKLNEIYGFFIFEYAGTEIESLAFRGELVGQGIQGNIYKFSDRKIFLFEIEINSVPIDAEEFLQVCDQYNLPHVPILNKHSQTLKDFLGGKSLVDVSNSPTNLYYWYPEYVPVNQLREGIVIKPMREMVYDTKEKQAFYRDDLDSTRNYQRIFIKQRSPDYLAKEK